MVLQFALIIDFHLFFKIGNHLLFFNVSFSLFGDIVWENLDGGKEIRVNFLHCADPKTRESEPKEIEFVDFYFLRDPIARDF